MHRLEKDPVEAAPSGKVVAPDPGEARGWDGLVEWTGGIPPESVAPLVAARRLEPVYPLLHALVGTGPRDFLARSAALEALVADGRATFGHDELAEVLYWLDEPARDRTVGALRRSGWIGFEPAQGTSLTDLGRWAYDVLSFLHRRLDAGELLPSVAGVDYALDIGLDPLRHLQSMRARLVALREEMEAARRTHSEVALRDAARKLDDALELSAQIRQVLDRVPLDHAAARAVARDVHDLLSRLHQVAAELQSAVTEVGRQYLRLTAGLTVEQIVRALMSCSRDTLAEVARDALLPVHVPPPLLTPEVVAGAGEWQFARERGAKEPVRWEEPPPPDRDDGAVLVPEMVRDFLAALEEVAAGTLPVPLLAIVPRDDHATSFLRASLLPLAGDARAGEGVAGQLGALRLDVRSGGDGWPDDLEDAPLRRLTPGAVVPRGGPR